MSARSPITSTRVLGSTTSERSCRAAKGASSPVMSTTSTSGLGILRSRAVAWRIELRRTEIEGTSSDIPSRSAISLSASVTKATTAERSTGLAAASCGCGASVLVAMLR